MNFSEWLKEQPGRSAMVARHFEVTQAAVTQWETNGVPVRRMVAVQALSGGRVKVLDMVVDRARPKQAA